MTDIANGWINPQLPHSLGSLMGGGPRMQAYLAAGNPALGSDEWRALRQQGQHPFVDWLRANRPQFDYQPPQFPQPQPYGHPNGNTGIVPPHMQGGQGIAVGEYNPATPRPMYQGASPSGLGGLMAPMGSGFGSADRRRPTPYAPR